METAGNVRLPPNPANLRPTGVGPLRGYDRPSQSTDATGCSWVPCVVNDAMGNKWPRSGIVFAVATVAILTSPESSL